MAEPAELFDTWGQKTVTYTDFTKGAYVPNDGQKRAIANAGHNPLSGGTGVANLTLLVLGDRDISELKCSYYAAVRAGSGRAPEIRIGQGLLRWITRGDQIVIGNIGKNVYVMKTSSSLIHEPDVLAGVARSTSRDVIKSKLATEKPLPVRKVRQVHDFVRDPWVVVGALLRSGGKCEMPGCSTPLFPRPDGSNYLEVHHIITLAEGGPDTIGNVAALCPSCHRELHHGYHSITKRSKLEKHVSTLIFP